MVYRTFGDLRNQVEVEMDTQDEAFVTEPEMMRYFNSAITLTEALIVKLGLREQYLKNDAVVSTVINQASYMLPADIVANKIRKIVYRNQTLVYTLKPYRGEGQFATEDVMNINLANGEYYHYSLYKSGNVQAIRLSPTPQVAVANALRIVYHKSLQRYTQDSDICDVPEICLEYIMAYVRYRVMAKEGPNNMNAQDEKQNVQLLQSMMTDTLSEQIADPDMELVDADWSHYEEMV